MSLLSTEQLFYEKQQDTAAQLKITRQLVMLHAASCSITATLDSKQVSEIIVQEFSNLLSASSCTLGVWDEENSRIEILAKYQPANPEMEQSDNGSIVRANPKIVEKILSRRNVLHITKNMPGADKEILSALEEEGVTSLLYLPLIIHNRIFGFIEVLSNSLHTYETYEIVIARLLADQAMISIENARLYQSAKQEIEARQRTEEKLSWELIYTVFVV